MRFDPDDVCVVCVCVRVYVCVCLVCVVCLRVCNPGFAYVFLEFKKMLILQIETYIMHNTRQ